MKKVILICLAGVILSIYSIAHSATIGNIAGTHGASGRYSLGIEYDSVFDRDMAFDGGNAAREVLFATNPEFFPEPGEGIADIEAKSNRVLLRGAVGLMSWLEFFVKLGVADAELNYTIKSPVKADQKVKYDGSFGFAYGAGLKARIVNWGRWAIISDFQFLRYEVEGDYKIDGVDFAGLLSTSLTSARSRSEATVQEIQLAIYIAGTIGILTPYGGLKISDPAMKIDNKATGIDLTLFSTASQLQHEEHESADNVGVFLGTGLEMDGPWTANIEIRFIDETAVSIGLNRHF